MKLIKDLNPGGVVLYWSGAKAKKLSPDFCSLTESEEWWKKYHFSLYQGEERRASIYDRRKDEVKRHFFDIHNCFFRQNPGGRRITDEEVKVDVGLSLLKQRLKVI